MAFIAINAKSDIEADGNTPSATKKKGKLTPAQNAMVNAFCLTKKTGIFNVGEKCETTANAYAGNGREATVMFKSGFFAVCGRIVEVEYGTTVTIPLPVSGIEYGKIVATFNLLQSKNNEFMVTARVGGDLQEDNLNTNLDGTYDFVLYDYTAYSEREGNKVELKERPASVYIDDVSWSLAKIEQRLSSLGFKTGSVTLTIGTATPLLEVSQSSNKVQLARQGNYVIGHFEVKTAVIYENNTVFTLPDGFKPRKPVSFFVGLNIISASSPGMSFVSATITIDTNGTAVISGIYENFYIDFLEINFGFEA